MGKMAKLKKLKGMISKGKSHQKYVLTSKKNLQIINNTPKKYASSIRNSLDIMYRTSPKFCSKKKNKWGATSPIGKWHPEIISLDNDKVSDPEMICIDENDRRTAHGSRHHPEIINLDDEADGTAASFKPIRNRGKVPSNREPCPEISIIDDDDICINIDKGTKKLHFKSAVAASRENNIPNTVPVANAEQSLNVSQIPIPSTPVTKLSKSNSLKPLAVPPFPFFSVSQSTPVRHVSSYSPVPKMPPESSILKTSRNSTAAESFPPPVAVQSEHNISVKDSLILCENLASDKPHSQSAVSISDLTRSNFTPYKRAFELPDQNEIKRFKTMDLLPVPIDHVSNYIRNRTPSVKETPPQSSNFTPRYALRSRSLPSSTPRSLGDSPTFNSGTPKSQKLNRMTNDLLTPIGVPLVITKGNKNQSRQVGLKNKRTSVSFQHVTNKSNVGSKNKRDCVSFQHVPNNLNNDSLYNPGIQQNPESAVDHNALNLSGNSLKSGKGTVQNVGCSEDALLNDNEAEITMESISSQEPDFSSLKLDFIPLPAVSKRDESILVRKYHSNKSRRSLSKQVISPTPKSRKFKKKEEKPQKTSKKKKNPERYKKDRSHLLKVTDGLIEESKAIERKMEAQVEKNKKKQGMNQSFASRFRNTFLKRKGKRLRKQLSKYQHKIKNLETEIPNLPSGIDYTSHLFATRTDDNKSCKGKYTPKIFDNRTAGDKTSRSPDAASKRFVDLEENQPRPGDRCGDFTWLTLDECQTDLEEPSCSGGNEVPNYLAKECFEFTLPGRDSIAEDAVPRENRPSRSRRDSESSVEEVRKNPKNVKNVEVVQIDDRSEGEISDSDSEQSFMIDVGTNVFVPYGVSFKGRRPVIIDGSNVAFGHGLSTRGLRVFSSRGVEICASFFTKRGHKVIVFIPLFRRWCPKTLNPEILQRMSDRGLITYTPSRRVRDKLTVPYDDRYIVQCAVALGGVIVSTDNFKDLLRENSTWKSTIEKRLLMFTFVGDMLMFPQDPLGRHGPKLDQFLLFPN